MQGLGLGRKSCIIKTYTSKVFQVRRCEKLPSLFLEDLLLFCVESAAGSRVAYFAELDTLKNDVPELHRFSCPKKIFDSLILGGLYSVRSSGRRIFAISLQGEYDIDDGYFSLLLELKSIRYRKGERLYAFDPSEYYSFFELRSLMEYKEPPAYRAVNWLIRAGLYLPALVLPPVGYILLLSALLRSSASAGAPLLLILSLPAMVFAMAASYQLCAMTLLKMERTRYGLLRAYTLRHGGLRLALTMAPTAKKKFFAFGAASAAALGLGIGLLFLL